MATGTTAVRSPTDDLSNHTIVLRQLKEVAEVGQRLRGDPLDSFVRVKELVNSGIARFTNNQIQPPEAAGSVTVSVTNSITGNGTSGSPLKLSGDSASPGNSMVYGTNGSGVKGWYTASGGGSTTLSGLTDVSLASLADGQVLTYDQASSKWKNKADPGGAPIIDTPPASPTAWDDEFNTGTGLDTTGSRRVGANAWSYLSGTSWPVATLTVGSGWLRIPGASSPHAAFCAKQALPVSGAWCFVMRVIGPPASSGNYGPGLALINNSVSTNNLTQIMGFSNALYSQTNSYNPSTGNFTFVSNNSSISFTTTGWYYIALSYPGSGTTYTLGYSTLASQQALAITTPTEYLPSGPAQMPSGFTQHTTFTLSGATHIALITVDSAIVTYVDWFRRTL
jgi:hypothetical protein